MVEKKTVAERMCSRVLGSLREALEVSAGRGSSVSAQGSREAVKHLG